MNSPKSRWRIPPPMTLRARVARFCKISQCPKRSFTTTPLSSPFSSAPSLPAAFHKHHLQILSSLNPIILFSHYFCVSVNTQVAFRQHDDRVNRPIGHFFPPRRGT